MSILHIGIGAARVTRQCHAEKCLVFTSVSSEYATIRADRRDTVTTRNERTKSRADDNGMTKFPRELATVRTSVRYRREVPTADITLKLWVARARRTFESFSVGYVIPDRRASSIAIWHNPGACDSDPLTVDPRQSRILRYTRVYR